MTICHELYHKWQFTANPAMPLIYLCNSLISVFFNYFFTQKYSIFLEGDVAKYIDNDINREKLKYFNESIYYLDYCARIFMIKKLLENDDYIKNFKNIYDKNNNDKKTKFESIIQRK